MYPTFASKSPLPPKYFLYKCSVPQKHPFANVATSVVAELIAFCIAVDEKNPCVAIIQRQSYASSEFIWLGNNLSHSLIHLQRRAHLHTDMSTPDQPIYSNAFGVPPHLPPVNHEWISSRLCTSTSWRYTDPQTDRRSCLRYIGYIYVGVLATPLVEAHGQVRS